MTKEVFMNRQTKIALFTFAALSACGPRVYDIPKPIPYPWNDNGVVISPRAPAAHYEYHCHQIFNRHGATPNFYCHTDWFNHVSHSHPKQDRNGLTLGPGFPADDLDRRVKLMWEQIYRQRHPGQTFPQQHWNARPNVTYGRPNNNNILGSAVAGAGAGAVICAILDNCKVGEGALAGAAGGAVFDILRP